MQRQKEKVFLLLEESYFKKIKLPCGVMVAHRILVPFVRVRVFPRQLKIAESIAQLFFYTLFLFTPFIQALFGGREKSRCFNLYIEEPINYHNNSLFRTIFLFKNIIMFFSPSKHHVYYREQRFTEFCYSVFRARWMFRIYCLSYQSIFYQFLKLDIKYSRSCLRKTFMDFTWPHWIV